MWVCGACEQRNATRTGIVIGMRDTLHLAARAPVRHVSHATRDHDAEKVAVELCADLDEVGVIPKRDPPLEMACKK